MKGLPTQGRLGVLRRGLPIDGVMTNPAKVNFQESREGKAWISIRIAEGVITSYSIHYTKLYDTVEYSSLKLDLYRRDFTINTLAVRLNPDVFGELIDFFGAQRDIKERVLRILHSLSFVEDPSRILRARNNFV